MSFGSHHFVLLIYDVSASTIFIVIYDHISLSYPLDRFHFFSYSDCEFLLNKLRLIVYFNLILLIHLAVCMLYCRDVAIAVCQFIFSFSFIVDGDDLFFSPAEADLHPSLEPVIEPIRKQLILSRLVNAWSNSLKPEQRSLYEGADIVMPASMSDAIWFATDLADQH